jgi:hypothetical protein
MRGASPPRGTQPPRPWLSDGAGLGQFRASVSVRVNMQPPPPALLAWLAAPVVQRELVGTERAATDDGCEIAAVPRLAPQA